MPRLSQVSGRFVVAANGLMEGQQGQGSTLLLPNLTSVSNCTFRHLTDLQIPLLSQVGATLSLDETNLKTIQAPKLKSVGQTLGIVSNNHLTNVSFTELTTIGGALLIANNTELTNVNGFNQLEEIAGFLNMRGAFNNVSFPAVSSVQGGMSILSSSKDFDCSTLSQVKAAARGKTVVCQGMVKSAKPTSGDSSEDDPSGSSSSSAAATVVNHKGMIWVIIAILTMA